MEKPIRGSFDPIIVHRDIDEVSVVVEDRFLSQEDVNNSNEHVRFDKMSMDNLDLILFENSVEIKEGTE